MFFLYKDLEKQKERALPITMLLLRCLTPEEYPIKFLPIMQEETMPDPPMEDISLVTPAPPSAPSTPEIITPPERSDSNTPTWLQSMSLKFWGRS